MFEQPIDLPAGTKLSVAAVYDNSPANPRNPNTPPKLVSAGEATTDENVWRRTLIPVVR